MSETTLIKEWVDECEKKGKKQSKKEWGSKSETNYIN